MKYLFTYLLIVLYHLNSYGQIQDTIELNYIVDSIQNSIGQNTGEIQKLQTENIELKKMLSHYLNQKNNIILSRLNGKIYYCTMGTLLYKEPTLINSITSISTGEKVTVIEIIDNVFKIHFNGQKGFSLKFGFISEIEYNRNAEEKQIEQHEIIEKYLESERISEAAIEKKKTDNLKKYGQSIGVKLNQGKIWLGMTSEMVLDSWGEPLRKNRNVGKWGVNEQWVYGRGGGYLYFENGKLTSWQD